MGATEPGQESFGLKTCDLAYLGVVLGDSLQAVLRRLDLPFRILCQLSRSSVKESRLQCHSAAVPGVIKASQGWVGHVVPGSNWGWLYAKACT